MTVIGIHHASVLVTDLEASAIFYESVLGLSRCDRPGKPFEGRWYQAGHQQIHLIVSANTGRDHMDAYPGTQRHIALMVEDLAGLTDKLQQAGVPCTASRSGRPVTFCYDPDGNVFELIGSS